MVSWLTVKFHWKIAAENSVCTALHKLLSSVFEDHVQKIHIVAFCASAHPIDLAGGIVFWGCGLCISVFTDGDILQQACHQLLLPAGLSLWITVFGEPLITLALNHWYNNSRTTVTPVTVTPVLDSGCSGQGLSLQGSVTECTFSFVTN